MAIDYSRLSRIVDGKQEKPAKVAPKKPAKVAPKKVEDSAKQEPITDSKKAEKKKIQDSLKKNAGARKYKAFKVTDSYKSYKKFIKDALEDTESTDEAVAVGISALDSVPADEAIAAVIEVLGEAIDILQEQCPECAEGEGEPAEVAEPEELDEDADGEEIEDSVSVSVTNGAGETVTVDSEDGNSAVASDVAPVGAPVDDFGAEPMGEELPEEPMGEELPEEGIGDSKRGKKAKKSTKKRIRDNKDDLKEVKKQMGTREGGKALNALRATKQDKGALKQAAHKLSPELREAEQGLQELLSENGLSESDILAMIGNGDLAGALSKLSSIGALDLVASASHNAVSDSKKRIKDGCDVNKAMDVLNSGEYSYDCFEGELVITGDDGCSFTLDLNKLTPELLSKLMGAKVGDSKKRIKDGMSNEEADALDAAQGDIFAEIEALIKAGKTQEALDALAANKQTLEALGK